jgi:hypothetical protein
MKVRIGSVQGFFLEEIHYKVFQLVMNQNFDLRILVNRPTGHALIEFYLSKNNFA